MKETKRNPSKSSNGNERIRRFVQVTHDLFDRGKYLTTAAKWLYVVIRSFHNKNTKKTFPGYQKIMERGGMTKNAVAKGMKELEHWGYIRRKRNYEKSNDYEFCAPSASNSEGEVIYYPTEKMAKEWAQSKKKAPNTNERMTKIVDELLSLRLKK